MKVCNNLVPKHLVKFNMCFFLSFVYAYKMLLPYMYLLNFLYVLIFVCDSFAAHKIT